MAFDYFCESMTTPMIQAFHRALQLSASLGEHVSEIQSIQGKHDQGCNKLLMFWGVLQDSSSPPEASKQLFALIGHDMIREWQAALRAGQVQVQPLMSHSMFIDLPCSWSSSLSAPCFIANVVVPPAHTEYAAGVCSCVPDR